jgi:pimeloyl-ACP methyl ester carboxylesterase
MPVSDGIYYLESGREYHRFPAVLLIHGEGGNSTSWPAEIRRLKGYRTIAVDLPGHGRSDGTALQSVKAYCERVCSFLESMKITRVIVVGHSMGGAIALMMAVRRSRVVAGLGMVSSGAYLGGETEILEQLSTPFGFTRGLHIIQQKAFGSRATPGLIKNVIQTLEKARHGVLFSDWCACAQFDLRAEIEKIEVPVWVAVGTEDQITPRAYSQYVFDQLTNASFQAIEGGGHMVLQEAGDEVALGLRAFLERIDFSGQVPGQRDTYTSSDSEGKPRSQFSLL